MNNPLLTEDIGVHFIDMDPGVEEQVIYNEDGSFTLLINSRLNWERQMQAYQHGMRHIAEEHFNLPDADNIEQAM